MRAAVPSLKQGLRQVGKHALKTGIVVLRDVASGENIRSSVKRRAKENLSEMISAPLSKRQKVSAKRKPISRMKDRSGRGRKRIYDG